MTEPSPATPEPLRRRRLRDRAPGGTGEDDSWAHLVGVDRAWDADAGQGEPPPPPPAAGEVDAPPAAGRDRSREGVDAPPLSRRAARRREAAVEAAADQDTAARAAEPPSTGGVPLRPWWASAAAGDSAPAGSAPGDPGVPPAFLRREPVPPPPVEQPAVPPSAEPVPAAPPAPETFLPREQPQVNPWPGQVLPALPPTGPSGSRPGPAQRTSDVAGTRSRPEPPAEVVLPADVVTVTGPTTAPVAAPITGPHGLGAPAPMVDPVPFGTVPVLPAPELPGPVLPGVEALTEPSRTPGEQVSASAPLTRRRARTAPSSEAATGTLYLPTTSAAGAAPETDLRVVPATPAAPPSAPPAASAPAAVRGGTPVRRRRLSSPPTRFPALGPTGEVMDADPAVTDVAPSRSASTSAASSTPTASARGRRTPAGAATPPVGLTGLAGLPSVSGPATGTLGSGGLSLPSISPALPGAAASASGALADAAAGGAGAAGASGAAASGGLDVVAGLGPAARGSRRPDAGRLRGRSAARTPLRAVGTDDDDATRTITPVRSHGAVASGQGETPSPRRSARNAETALSGAVAGDETTSTPGAARDETAETRPVRPLAGGGGAAGGPAADGARRATPTRRSVRTGQTGETPPVTLAPVPSASPGRAGRNLPAAIAVGVGLAGAVIASLLVRKEAFVLVIAAAIIVALWELAGALRSKRIEVPVVPLGVGALGMLVSAFVAGEDGLLVSFALTAFGVLLWRIIDGHEGATRDVAASVFVAAYVPFLAGFAMLMLAMPDGALRVLTFIAVTVSNDIGGYATGVLAGRHPMAPTISPKKSWEGMAGSVALCMVVGAVTVHYLLHGSVFAGLAVGAAAAVTATIGDLSESLIKRDLGIKDMGSLLPGHGGIMDRLDSLLPTAPAAYLLLLLLVPVVR